MRIIFFGTTGLFSVAPLSSLLAAGAAVQAVVVARTGFHGGAFPHRLTPPPPPPTDLPLLTPQVSRNILHVAWEHNLPVWEIASLRDRHTLDWLATFHPDLICVAGFPLIFPPPLLNLPRYGCLNLHPSLLPAHRGPSPLAEALRQGEAKTGVTLHFMDEGIDTGAIVAQGVVEIEHGITGAELERRCSEVGAQLLVSAVKRLERTGSLPARPQSLNPPIPESPNLQSSISNSHPGG